MTMNIVTSRQVGFSPAVPQTASAQVAEVPVPSDSQRIGDVVKATPTPLSRLLADRENVENLALRLRGIEPWFDSHSSAWVDDTMIGVLQGSSYASTGGTSVKVSTFITDLGYKIPTTKQELSDLASALEQRVLKHPLGDLGGGLTWPVPMSQADQDKLKLFLGSPHPSFPDFPLHIHKNTLSYLLSGSSVTSEDLKHPVDALQKLLDSPKAQALGQALQTHLNGVASDTSVYDYLLAALNIGFNLSSIAAPARNEIVAFNLQKPDHWGKKPSEVVAGLKHWLVEIDRATSTTAPLAARLLLGVSAPQYQIKDIPDSVTIGSLAWVNLSIAAATVEAEQPGAVANMSYAQVMSYAKTTEGQPHAIASAQRNALVDWAVINGVIEKSADDIYNPAQLETIRKSFNRQTNERLLASQALDKPIPTRKELALEKLKERFGDLGALFEEKLLGTDEYQGEPGQVGLGGMHSLLDIAMMDLPNSRPFTSSDPRIPLETLNKDRTFGVAQAFDQQFAHSIEEKKKAVITTVQHMIAQLPLEDRKKFDFGKLTFFQLGSYELGEQLWGSTPNANEPELLVKAELNGETQAYSINFNRGTIEKTSLHRITKPKERSANTVFTVKEFNPGGEAGHVSNQRQLDDKPLDSFNSGRSYQVGRIFAEHLNLDDPAIKENARGQTTLDKLNGGPKPLGDFLLNLIPFRSAIVNFQKGNYGDGVFDLTLDIFGFLTAGAATAGKLIKLGGSALSSGAKALQAGKIIGVATIGVLNPVSGLGDLAATGGKLLGKGVSKLLSKGSEIVNTLKGATGSYDLLKAASKNQGIMATGTYTFAEQTIEGGAVFRDGKWYGYDPVGKRPYGAEIKGFIPNVVAFEGEVRALTDTWIGKMIGSVLAPPAPNPYFRRDYRLAVQNAQTVDKAAFIRGQNTATPPTIYGYSSAMKQDDLKRLAVAEARTPQELGSLERRISELDVLPDRLKTARETAEIVDLDAYQKGYNSGKPTAISGFSEGLTNNQLAELAVVRGRTPEEVGQLVRYIENQRINTSLENFRVFSEEVTAAGGKVTPLPQGFYLSQVALLSEGECAALSNAFAAAVKQGKQDILIKNLYTAMVPTLSPLQISELRKVDPAKALLEQNRATKANQFREHLNELQSLLQTQFHHGMQSRQITHTAIIAELANATSSKALLIEARGHGITAGVVIKGGKKEWFYFDPNFGKATFTSEAAMSAGLESTLKTGRTKQLLPDFGTKPGVPEYKVSTFQEVELNTITRSVPGDISDLFNTEL
ncbi:hypothetical protein [Pseudomonas tolaasii]|nr:hypothetical protein [Pseudomonas tolaasii]ARB30137.1 hypothetical protein B5P22_23545 [Pseudomonas tolaasii]PKA77678.1 hypothetical protein ATI14_4735 [Pseudomonas tolaasii NCPPB 2192]